MKKDLYTTDEEKTKFLSKRGNIITFKKPIYPNAPAELAHTQIIVSRLKRDRSGAVMIDGLYYDTPWYNSIAELMAAVDWDFMREAHREEPIRRRRM